MGVDDRDFRRATEDVHFVQVGESLGFSGSSSGVVRYVKVARQQGEGPVLGYLWYSDAENAAGYVAREAEGDDAFNAGAYWYDRLAAARQRGLTPSQAVAELVEANVGGKSTGWIVPDSEAEAQGVAQLKA
ncbi:hypothetical protein [Streptomonospora wellingtoniae]|uniref:Uncharacterized protein n=1 Tax=Streptomonospora wellingtoniae TaxID=3075544 RepID=A0ABU2KY38_9ACTN|nr:hypothetical protein [Streptomonospora sp. DSM 45055]MDT0304224.1 hypothetical protein [Streptomonospora sp. DSM 45055]